MIYLPGLGVALAVLWFALSGRTEAQFLILSVVSVLGALWLSARLQLIDRDASPYHRLPVLTAYSGWLGVEIIKSNIQVIRSVFDPRRGVDPGVVRLDVAMCRSDMAKTIFANSITLTPGTVTVVVDDGHMTVHALHKSNATVEAFTEMLERSVRAADGPERVVQEAGSADAARKGKG